MLTYEYTAKDPSTGREVKSEITADNEAAAAKLIAEQGFAPIDVHIKGEKRSFRSLKSKISAKDKVLFSRQLSTLINAGMPLTQSLRTVTEQMTNKVFVTIISKIIADVESGSALAKAFAKHPDVFNDVYINLVAAGETSGTLDLALERLASQQEKDAQILSKIKGAMVYPVLVLVVIFGVIIFMMITVLPQVEQLYVDIGQDMPLMTNLLLGVSRFMMGFWWLLILVLIGSAWGLKQYSKTASGRSKFDLLKMRSPVVGKLFMKLYMARFTRTGQTLLASGVQMLEMMNITAKAVNNVHIRDALIKAQSQVKAGITLSDALTKDPNFLPLVPQMIHIGEESGSIDGMLGKAADYYEAELDNQIKALSTIIEPILMIVLAGMAAILVIAILVPIYGLVGTNLGV